MSISTRLNAKPCLERLEDRNCPAPFSVIGATGSPTNILSVKVFDDSGSEVASVQPFNNLTSIRVATGDFDGDGIDDEVAVLGRRTNSDLRAEIVTYDMNTATGALTESGRFFAFDDGILGNGFITAGDFDGDGDDDIAVAQIGGGRTTVTLQTHTSNGDGSFTMGGGLQVDFGTISAPRIGAGDTDNDGFDEIVVAARTAAGADVRVFDADGASPTQQGQFTWTFGVDGYARGAFVAVGEFDPTFNGQEIVLGSNVGGAGRVDVVNFDGADATLVTNGRFQPFEATTPGYNAAVRVAVGTVLDDNDGNPIMRNVILAGQDRFQSGQAVFNDLNFDYTTTNRQDPNPNFLTDMPFTVLTGADGSAPGGGLLGPFVSFANTSLVKRRGGMTARQLTPSIDLDVIVGDNVIAAGDAAIFVIPNTLLGLPTGADFNNADNRLILNFNLATDVPGDLSATSPIADLAYFPTATGAPTFFRVIGGFNVNFNPLQATVQIADGLPVMLGSAFPVGEQVFGHFAGQQPLDDFFLPGSMASITDPAGFWALTISNQSGTGNLTLLDWEVFWNFDV